MADLTIFNWNVQGSIAHSSLLWILKTCHRYESVPYLTQSVYGYVLGNNMVSVGGGCMVAVYIPFSFPIPLLGLFPYHTEIANVAYFRYLKRTLFYIKRVQRSIFGNLLVFEVIKTWALWPFWSPCNFMCSGN